MPFNGVLISWLTLARNRFFAFSAFSAMICFTRSSSSSAFSFLAFSVVALYLVLEATSHVATPRATQDGRTARLKLTG